MNQPIDSKPNVRSGRKAELSANSIRQPKVTRLSSNRETVRSYVASKPNKTHSGMLHQSRTLETPTADKSQERRETRRSPRSPEKSEVGQLADNIVEMSEPSRVPLPLEQSSETGAVTRPFVLGKGKRPLMPAHPARVRQLLRDRKATVSRRFPASTLAGIPAASRSESPDPSISKRPVYRPSKESPTNTAESCNQPTATPTNNPTQSFPRA